MKKIVIAGGTGFLGKLLTSHFVSKGFEVVILTRKHEIDGGSVRYVKWDAENLGYWVTALEGADTLINLNGKSVDCRYTEANKQAIYDTRINSTYILGVAMGQCKSPPKVWINASSATIYRHAEDRDMDEATGELGAGFSVDVCKKWEHTFFEAGVSNTRKVALRIAIVLGKSGGALDPLMGLTRIGMCGRQGSGRQYFSWIHEDDFVGSVDWVCENEIASGIYNLAAPDPLPNQQFMKILRKSLGVQLALPIPKWLLEIGARIIQTETELILKSRRVVPMRLLKEGFNFKYPKLGLALESLTKK